MRRDQIILGTEYCETAPHAYGQEPRGVPAYKVRFISLIPSRLLLHYEYTPEDHLGKPGLVEVGRETVTHDQAIAFEEDLHRSRRIAIERREPIQLLSYPFEKDALPCERWIKDEWIPGVCRPAAVHRTWGQHEARRAKMEEDRKQAKRLRAPAAFASNLQEMVVWAQFLEMDYGSVEDALRKEWDKQRRD